MHHSFGCLGATPDGTISLFAHVLPLVPFSEQRKPTFSISSSVLPLAPRTTIPKAAERLSGEKKMFSFLFLLLSSLKKSRQNLALAALREHIVALRLPATRERKI